MYCFNNNFWRRRLQYAGIDLQIPVVHVYLVKNNPDYSFQSCLICCLQLWQVRKFVVCYKELIISFDINQYLCTLNIDGEIENVFHYISTCTIINTCLCCKFDDSHILKKRMASLCKDL